MSNEAPNIKHILHTQNVDADDPTLSGEAALELAAKYFEQRAESGVENSIDFTDLISAKVDTSLFLECLSTSEKQRDDDRKLLMDVIELLTANNNQLNDTVIMLGDQIAKLNSACSTVMTKLSNEDVTNLDTDYPAVFQAALN